MTKIKPRNDLTAEYLRSILDYDPETGVFRWKFRSSNRLQSGDIAGSSGVYKYARICINRRSYPAHRLVWLHFYGRWPIDELDHQNLNPLDNRITNLREANVAQNHWNIPGWAKHGFKGVSYDRSHKQWVARISVNNKRHLLGRFPTAEAAHAAYTNAAKNLHGEFARY